MTPTLPRAGVCVVRVERQRSGTLITLVTNDDLDEVPPVEDVHRMTDIDTALALVREFLVGYAR
jgi:hypothetical protein